MQHQVLDIRAGAAGTTAKLYTYIRDESPEMEAHRRPAVVICPGGGYGMTSDREAEPVALKFLEKGFQCFVLRYSVEPVRFPAALLQLATAVAMVRSRADKWHVNADKIAVCGFSAGGHLAASLGVFWNLRRDPPVPPRRAGSDAGRREAERNDSRLSGHHLRRVRSPGLLHQSAGRPV